MLTTMFSRMGDGTIAFCAGIGSMALVIDTIEWCGVGLPSAA